MRFFIPLFWTAVLLFSCSGRGTLPGSGAVFPRVSNAGKGTDPGILERRSSAFFNDTVHVVRITLDEGVLSDRVLRGSGRYSRADLEFDGEKLAHIGVRIRGSHWSRRLKKKQFKIHFGKLKLMIDGSGKTKTFSANKGRRFHGLRKINLRCNADNDPGLITDKLTSEVFLAAGALYPRTGMARLWINGRYQGLYLLTEHPDSTLLRIRLGNSLGNQFKGRWRSRSAMNLYPGRYVAAAYKPVRRLNNRNREDLLNFMRGLQNVRGARDFAALVDVERFIAYWAAAVTAGHWDSLIGNMQNDHIFHNAADGKWYIIGWDGDNSFGIGERKRWTPFAVSTTAPLLNAFGSRDKTLLFNRAHAIPEIVAAYRKKVRAMLSSGFSEDRLIGRIDFLAGKLRPFLKEEPPTSVLTSSAFETAVQEMKGYVRARHAYLRAVFKGEK